MDQSQDNLGAIVKSLNPTMSYAVSALGASNNPQIKHQAKLYTAQAVRTYDPASGASLSTWVQGQLKRLRRYKREKAGPVPVPDRAQLDAYTLEKARVQYLDDHGVEPDIKQLADLSKIPVKRIGDVQRTTRAVPSDSQLPSTEDTGTDYMDEATEYVYDESDHKDRKILEYTTGFGGTQMLNKSEIATKLQISPAQVTRRSARIGMRVQEMNDNLETIT